MTGPLADVAVAASLILAAWCAILLVLTRAPGRSLWVGVAVTELILAVFVVWGLVELVTRDAEFARLEFALYLAGLVAVLPGAAWWVRAEKSRAAAGVLVVASLVATFMVLRVQQVWAGSGA